MKKVSVIIIYNNKEKVDEAVEYIKKQTLYAETEVIAVDNRDKEFYSASIAMNYASEKAEGEVLVYIHQDMLLTDTDTLKKYYDFITEKEDVIVGAVGYSIEDKHVITDIARWSERVYNMPPANGKIKKVYSLDECMFAMKKSLWQKLRFNEEVCDNWHYYAVEICYRNMLNGGENYVLPLKLWHKSVKCLSLDNNFMLATKKFIKEYRGKIKMLYAPCITIKCNMTAFRLYKLKRKVKKILKK